MHKRSPYIWDYQGQISSSDRDPLVWADNPGYRSEVYTLTKQVVEMRQDSMENQGSATRQVLTIIDTQAL